MTKIWMNLFTSAALALSLTACTDDGAEDDDIGDTGEETTEDETAEETETETGTEAETTETETETETTDTETDTTETDTESMDLSFETDIYPIIADNCSCHVGGMPSGLSMADSDTAYGNLVGVASQQDPQTNRIEAGNPADSYLVHKIEGTQGVGGQMPPGGMALSDMDQMMISDWITQGAQP